MKKILKILLILNISVLIVSFSISVVILFRPFYYVQIKTLNIEKETGYTYEEIKEAYDDIINYTTLNKPFRTGKLKYSSSGKNHFKDCKVLFTINFIILGFSIIIFIIKKKYLNNLKIKNHSIEFWSSCLIIISLTILLLILLIVGFDKCFEIFHQLFFLGKSNWLLNPDKDEIINILPEIYFMNCTILIISIIVTISIGLLIRDKYKKIDKKINILYK